MKRGGKISRRSVLSGVASIAGAAALVEASANGMKVEKAGGRIRQSAAFWSFATADERPTLNEFCQIVKDVGCRSVELVTREQELSIIQRHGLECALLGQELTTDLPWRKGFNNPQHWDELFGQTKQSIDLAAAYGIRNLIAFTGIEVRDVKNPLSPRIPREEGLRNCIEGFKRMVEYAELKGVVLNLEQLNSRSFKEPFHGFPGYQGDHFDFCLEIVETVDSPNLKLLFDVYHTQVMDGDVMSKLRNHIDRIGHIHTAGVPGRGRLDDLQEISYPNVMKLLVELNYQGYVGHEFIPSRDTFGALRAAVEMCDV